MTYVDTSFKPPVGISVCSGYRGLERGLEMALRYLRYGYFFFGETSEEHRVIKLAATVEIESLVALNLVREMEQDMVAPCPLWTDLKTFEFERFYRKIHFITGGYPCQPFSSAGNQHGVLDPRHLFPYIDKGIGAARPVFCWFENVANHLNIGYDEVRSRLQALGYQVEEGIFSAEQVGAPHLRKRLFVLAVANAYCTESSKKRGDLAKMLGIQEEQRQSKHSAFISGGDSAELGETGLMDYAFSIGHPKENQVCAGRSRPACTSSAVDNSEYQGLERYDRNDSIKTRWQKQIRSIAETSLWPAGQGVDQYEFEPPRLESSVGYVVDGFDFTEDLLRMAGNAVVPQQSCAAFLTLIHKFL